MILVWRVVWRLGLFMICFEKVETTWVFDWDVFFVFGFWDAASCCWSLASVVGCFWLLCRMLGVES